MKNAPQPHGVFRDNEIVWAFPSRGVSFEAFDISKNGKGTKKAVSEIQSSGELKLGSIRCVIKPISEELYETLTIRPSLTNEVVQCLKAQRDVPYKTPFVASSPLRFCVSCDEFHPPSAFSTGRNMCKVAKRKQQQTSKKRAAEEGALKECSRCSKSLPVDKFHGALCNSCHWQNKVLLKKELLKDFDDGGRARALELKLFPKTCLHCPKLFDETLFKYDSQKGAFVSICHACHLRKYNMCQRCGITVAHHKDTEGVSVCASCNPNSATVLHYNETRAEMRVNRFLGREFPSETFPVGTYAPFSTCGDRGKPDTVMLFPTRRHNFLIETDEHHHSSYTEQCEWKKILNHVQSFLQSYDPQKVTVIRFNPDAWKVNGKAVRYKFEDRLTILKGVVAQSLETQESFLEVHHLFYPTQSNSSPIHTVCQEDVVHMVNLLSS